MSGITRLLGKDFPLVSESGLGIAAAATSANGSTRNADDTASLADTIDSTSSRSSSADATPVTVTVENGPFAGISLPNASARANALHIVRECVASYLITHPHLDHLAAFAINTAAFHNTTRPKRLAALPSTVNAIKSHIFNDIIWPNLTDEDGGVGFVTFQRLTEGGNLAVGEGAGKGYIEVCNGLCAKGMKLSHGHCLRAPPGTISHRGSNVGLSEATVVKVASGLGDASSSKGRKSSVTGALSNPGTPGMTATNEHVTREVVVDSTAYFIRDDASGREILMFGDVEPDALSLAPRNVHVWSEAAPKIAAGILKGIFIECSYDDSQADSVLFGHLAPRHLIHELRVLAGIVRESKMQEREHKMSRKRKRLGAVESAKASPRDEALSPASSSNASPDGANQPGRGSVKRGRPSRPTVSTVSSNKPPVPDEEISPGTKFNGSHHSTFSQSLPLELYDVHSTTSAVAHAYLEEPPLKGLTVIIMHMKDTLRDGPLVGENILRQLKDHDERLKQSEDVGLGCDFVISAVGGSYYF